MSLHINLTLVFMASTSNHHCNASVFIIFLLQWGALLMPHDFLNYPIMMISTYRILFCIFLLQMDPLPRSYLTKWIHYSIHGLLYRNKVRMSYSKRIKRLMRRKWNSSELCTAASLQFSDCPFPYLRYQWLMSQNAPMERSQLFNQCSIQRTWLFG